jgi:hypothetical protein
MDAFHLCKCCGRGFQLSALFAEAIGAKLWKKRGKDMNEFIQRYELNEQILHNSGYLIVSNNVIKCKDLKDETYFNLLKNMLTFKDGGKNGTK